MGNHPSKPNSRPTTHHGKDERSRKSESKEVEREKELDRQRWQRDQEREKDKEKRPNGWTSLHALSGSKATAADPSASIETALAQTVLQPSNQKPDLQHHLQGSSHHSDGHEKLSGLVEKPPSAGILDDDPRQSNDPSQEILLPERAIGPLAEPSTAMNVPASSITRSARKDREESVSSQSTPPASTTHYVPLSGMQRPPRLPLAIADEIRAPDSPPLSSTTKANEQVSIFDDEELNVPRKNSGLSATTNDDEEVPHELHRYAVDAGGVKAVPTRIEWKGKGERVYVTGTFAHWDTKYRLRPSAKGAGMSAVIGFPPGTHHLKFIVDGEMVPSTHLPTTVDIHNVLVNYIEVVAEEPSRSRRDTSQKPKPAPTNDYTPVALPGEDEAVSGDRTPDREEELKEPPDEEIPTGDFRQLMPQALVDMELPEDNPRFRQAYNIINDTAGPPSLPLFLGKSILNGILPHKDDNSVLTLPNHTVLNHLATSSIKNGVLATSVTTRYKKKYVTTIMYKPTFEVSEA